MAFRVVVCTLLVMLFATPSSGQDRPAANDEDRSLRDQILKRFDANEDGRIDEAERSRLQEAFQNQRNRGRLPAELLQRFDANGNGELEPAELAQARERFRALRNDDRPTPRPQGDTPRPETRPNDNAARNREALLLQRFDTNNNGQLDPDEREKLAQMIRQQQQRGGPGLAPANERPAKLDQSALLERFDANNNGQLDPEERRTALQKIRQRQAELNRD